MVFMPYLKIASKREQNQACLNYAEHERFQVPCLKNAINKDSNKSVKQRFLARLLRTKSKFEIYGQKLYCVEQFVCPSFNRCSIYCYPLAFLSIAQDFWLLLVTKVTNKNLKYELTQKLDTTNSNAHWLFGL